MVTAQRTWDFSLAYGILKDPIIWEDIREDGVEDFIPDVVKEYYVAIFNKENILGMYNLHQRFAVTWQVHAFILPQFRRKYSAEASQAVLKWVLEYVPGMQTLMCEVPLKFTNVIKHCKLMGFTETGVIPHAYLKDDKVWSIQILSISRKEIQKIVGE